MSKFTGKVAKIIGPVVDVVFDTTNAELPKIYDSLEITNADGSKLVLEVQSHIGEDTVRTISMDSTDGLSRGQEVVARLNTYEKVQKKLVKLVWNGTIKGKDLSMEGHTAGVITSALDGVGLGFVRNAYAKFGTILNCGAISVTVTEILAE